MDYDSIDAERIPQKPKSSFWSCLGCSLSLIILSALFVYLAPVIFLGIAFKSDEISAKRNSAQNITALINDSTINGAELKKEGDILTVSWETMSTPMLQVRYASSKDLGRLAVHVYNGPPYDHYKVNKKQLKVDFSNESKKVFTVVFTGN